MNLEPLRGWMIGRVAITKTSDLIATVDPNKGVTKFALIEWVSDEAERAGFKPGQLVMAKTMHNIFLNGGRYFRVTFPIEEAICRVNDIPLEDFIGSDGKPLDASGIVAPVDQAAA